MLDDPVFEGYRVSEEVDLANLDQVLVQYHGIAWPLVRKQRQMNHELQDVYHAEHRGQSLIHDEACSEATTYCGCRCELDSIGHSGQCVCELAILDLRRERLHHFILFVNIEVAV